MQSSPALWNDRGRNPILITDRQSRTWLVFYHAAGQAGQVLARDVRTGETLPVSNAGIDSADLAAVAGADGPAIVWNELVGGTYQLFESDLRDTPPRQITGGTASAIYPALASAAGALWLVYQAADDAGCFNIYMRRKAGGEWSKPVLVSDTPGNNWCPAITATANGRLAVAWDGYAVGSYDIYLRFVGPDASLQPTMRVTGDGFFHAHASLAAAPDGGVWLAWNRGTADWGKDNEVYRQHRIPDRNYLHVRRSVEVRRVTADGRLLPVFPPIQDVLDQHLPGLLHERPRLYASSGGPLYAAFRFNEGDPHGGHRTMKRWQAMLTCYDGAQWLQPVELDGSHGLSNGTIAIAETADGSIVAAATGEGGDNRTINLDTRVRIYRLQPLAEQIAVSDPPIELSFAQPPPRLGTPPRHSIQHQGEVLNLCFGDVHRHTEFSFCRTSVDGSLEEALRQTRDAAAMDFAMTADHDHQEQSPDMWAEVMAAADRFNVPGHFTTFFGYEWIGGRDNRRHRNVLSTVRVPPPPFDYGDSGHRDVRNLWAGLPPGKAITIPHHTACPMSLLWLKDPGEAADPAMEPLVEIFQASRASSEYPGCPTLCNSFFWTGQVRSFSVEGGFVSDALRQGIRMGFIASSDHMSAHRSYACVYARENTRGSLLDAMLKRHTYAASDRIICEFSIGDALMGEELAAAPRLDVRIRFAGTRPIREIALLRDSEPFRTWRPKGIDAEIITSLHEGESRGHCFYARMIQAGTNLAWSSPIWIV